MVGSEDGTFTGLSWTDPETGEITNYRKSPKKQTVYDLFSELIYIKDYINNKNLSFCVFEIATNEQKLLSLMKEQNLI